MFYMKDLPYESTLSDEIFFGRGPVRRLAHVGFGGNPTHSSLTFVDDVELLRRHVVIVVVVDKGEKGRWTVTSGSNGQKRTKKVRREVGKLI